LILHKKRVSQIFLNILCSRNDSVGTGFSLDFLTQILWKVSLNLENQWGYLQMKQYSPGIRTSSPVRDSEIRWLYEHLAKNKRFWTGGEGVGYWRNYISPVWLIYARNAYDWGAILNK
jgi:hypothetical protein